MKNIGFIGFLFFLGACTPVTVFYNHSVDFKQLHTFKFLKPDIKSIKNPLYQNEMFQDEIKQDVTYALQSQGMLEDKEEPDVYIKIHSYIEKQTVTNYSNNGYYNYPYSGYGMQGYGWRGTFGGGYGLRNGMMNNASTYRFNEGTLIIDVLGGKDKKEIIWRGSVKGDVDNVQKLQLKIKKGVALIFQNFPYKK